MSKNVLELNRSHMEQMREQADFNLQMYDKIKEHELKMDEHDKKMQEVENTVLSKITDLENNLSITHGECKFIKSKVSEKSYGLANQYFLNNVSDELFHKKRIHFLIGIYHALNKHFNSITYTTIRHIDFDKAMQFIEEIKVSDLPPNYWRLTDKQKELAERKGDIVNTLFSKGGGVIE
ncbi:ORF6C domain-containing protein [Mammaliicoccus vitulinus]|uniref:ORF6C domain-containing protein n=1 Tax=Mammaliicoccus vitulinus TaxID=71237 RepID=UPI0018679BC2|nr:ORF6C domain-containing protein [Mammaliicoccus vitulinus]